MNDDELLKYNHLGLIPGPEENSEDFFKRAQYCFALRNSFQTKLLDNAPFSEENRASDEILKAPFEKTKYLYDIAPAWIPVFFSNYKLSFWHGGCAWIFQENDNTPLGAFFQLRQAFKNSPTYLKIYKRDDLVAHELSHVGRMMFEEPRFEEILAYRSESSRFRRYFGPIMQSSWESALFVIFLFILVLLDLSLYEILSPSLYQSLMWLKLVPFGMIVYASARLWRRQRQFKRCFQNLKTILDDEKNANAVIYRLTDQEIIDLSALSLKEMIIYVNEQKTKSLRWRLIHLAYF